MKKLLFLTILLGNIAALATVTPEKIAQCLCMNVPHCNYKDLIKKKEVQPSIPVGPAIVEEEDSIKDLVALTKEEILKNPQKLQEFISLLEGLGDITGNQIESSEFHEASLLLFVAERLLVEREVSNDKRLSELKNPVIKGLAGYSKIVYMFINNPRLSKDDFFLARNWLMKILSAAFLLQKVVPSSAVSVQDLIKLGNYLVDTFKYDKPGKNDEFKKVMKKIADVFPMTGKAPTQEAGPAPTPEKAVTEEKRLSDFDRELQEAVQKREARKGGAKEDLLMKKKLNLSDLQQQLLAKAPISTNVDAVVGTMERALSALKLDPISNLLIASLVLLIEDFIPTLKLNVEAVFVNPATEQFILRAKIPGERTMDFLIDSSTSLDELNNTEIVTNFIPRDFPDFQKVY